MKRSLRTDYSASAFCRFSTLSLEASGLDHPWKLGAYWLVLLSDQVWHFLPNSDSFFKTFYLFSFLLPEKGKLFFLKCSPCPWFYVQDDGDKQKIKLSCTIPLHLWNLNPAGQAAIAIFLLCYQLFFLLCSHVFQNNAFSTPLCAPPCSLSSFLCLTDLISLTVIKGFKPPESDTRLERKTWAPTTSFLFILHDPALPYFASGRLHKALG